MYSKIKRRFSCVSSDRQDENRCLLERLMRYKSKDADKLNEENESFLR